MIKTKKITGKKLCLPRQVRCIDGIKQCLTTGKTCSDCPLYRVYKK